MLPVNHEGLVHPGRAARQLARAAGWPWRRSIESLEASIKTPSVSRDEVFMRLALGLAERGLSAGQLPIGAILVEDDRVLAEAYCSDKGWRMLEHPELLVLMEADLRTPTIEQRRQMTLYTNLEPCAMCLGAAMSFCLGRIVYALNAPADGAIQRFAGVPFGNDTCPEYRVPIVTGGVLRDESAALFRAFVDQSTDDHMIGFAKGVLVADPAELNMA